MFFHNLLFSLIQLYVKVIHIHMIILVHLFFTAVEYSSIWLYHNLPLSIMLLLDM